MNIDNNMRKWIGMAFVMTNEINNKVIAYMRDSTGALSSPKAYSTGGSGFGTNPPSVDPLGSQGSIIISPDNRFLFAVNAGSSTISSFLIYKEGLFLIDTIPSNGVFPNSLAIVGKSLYVTNVGNNSSLPNVSGFFIKPDGRLSFIDGSQRNLAADSKPGCIVSSLNMDKLIVSEKGSNNLVVFEVEKNGMLVGPVITPSNGNVPFGSAYLTTNLLLVTEAGSGALSSYCVSPDNTLNVISGSISTGNQIAPCWVSVTPNQCYAYTSNAGSATISLYQVHKCGTLSLIESIPISPNAASSSDTPLDSQIDRCGKNLYVLNGNQGFISVFQLENDGHPVLIQIFQNTLLPRVGAQGMAIL